MNAAWHFSQHQESHLKHETRENRQPDNEQKETEDLDTQKGNDGSGNTQWTQLTLINMTPIPMPLYCFCYVRQMIWYILDPGFIVQLGSSVFRFCPDSFRYLSANSNLVFLILLYFHSWVHLLIVGSGNDRPKKKEEI